MYKAAHDAAQVSQGPAEGSTIDMPNSLQTGPSVAFPLVARGQTGGAGSASGSGAEGQSASAGDESSAAHSLSSGPSPETSSTRLGNALAVRMPDRPRSPLVGRARLGAAASAAASGAGNTASSPNAKEEAVTADPAMPQPSGPALAPQRTSPQTPRAPTPPFALAEGNQSPSRRRPAQYNPPSLDSDDDPDTPSPQAKTAVARAGSPRPMRKFALRMDHKTSPGTHQHRRQRRASTTNEGAPAQRMHAQLHGDPSRQRPEEKGPGPRRTMPSLSLARDLTAINDALRESLDAVDKAESVLMTLAKFAIVPKNPAVVATRREALVEAGSITLMVEVQRMHAASAPVQAMAAWAIGSMAHEDGSMQAAFGQAGAVEAVVGAVRGHENSVWVIEFALRALSALTWEPANREAIGACGGLEVVIAAMGRHANMPTVQADGATLLANSAFGHEQNKVLLANSFALDAIVTAMRGFTQDATMQKHGCLAIRNLTWGLERNKEIAGVKGGVNAVIDALDAHAGDPSVVEQATAALCIMVEKVVCNIERMLNSSDWIAVLLGTLQGCPDTEAVQVNLLTVLAEAATARPDKVAALVDAGALDVALAGMRRNITRRPVMHAGAYAARALLASGAPEAEAALRGVGGIGTLLDMLYCSVTAPPPVVAGPPPDVIKKRSEMPTRLRARDGTRVRRASTGATPPVTGKLVQHAALF